MQDLRDLERVEPGFTPDGVFQARVSIPPSYRTPDEVSRFCERLSERIGSSPGVQHVGVISVAPLSGLLRTIPFSVQGQSTAERDRAMANVPTISPGYLDAVGTRLVRGRPEPPVSSVLAGYACTAYNRCMQYTIRGVPVAVDHALRERARVAGKSLNEAAVDALAEGSGMTGSRRKRRDLADIAKTWKADKAVEAALADQDRVDKDLWR